MNKQEEKKAQKTKTTPKAAWQTPKVEVLPVPDLTQGGSGPAHGDNFWYAS